MKLAAGMLALLAAVGLVLTARDLENSPPSNSAKVAPTESMRLEFPLGCALIVLGGFLRGSQTKAKLR